ncbi:hypothetical protein CPJCM30710_22960 [Clostridium polyendosporum]|uniref:AB hydrolase-1 domain-containing protein n=1 Tax=Clostridium polyendosporum TaxID=69208 RepID=A0A919RZV3_9CLOT|nr:alpha/beta fold hydrolase [Clostridium polyendosporum]GIM29630.1 hypothetical protein CPJCM30710_22960 [Clostridium polyendosporum]
MRFLPYSNGFHKIKVKRQLHPLETTKIVIYVLLIILILGFLYQVISDKVASVKIKPKSQYVRIDGKSFYYNLIGSGEYTVIFDGNIGTGSAQWSKIIKSLNKGFDGKVFVYDRAGYGFNDSGKAESPEQQARDLRMILKKAGVTGPYILVGEEYGSLVMTNYAKLYPQSVGGMILIDPINEKLLKDKTFIKSYKKESFKRAVEYYGSYIGFTSLINGVNLLDNPKGFLDQIGDWQKQAFLVERIRKNYTGAYYNELNNLIEANSTSQDEGLLNGKPVSIIINEKRNIEGQKEFSKLTSKELFDVYSVNPESDVISLENNDIVYNALKSITKKYKSMKKLEEQNTQR